MALHDDTHAHLLAHHGDFAGFAETMVQTHAGRFDAVFWSFLERHVPSVVHRVLDLGTGPGLLLADLAERYGDAEVIGVDGQPEMLARAEKVASENDRLRVIAHDLASAKPITGVEESSCDLVTASVLLHELQVPTRAIDEAGRALKPGGSLVVYDWIRRPLSAYFDGKRPETLDQFTHFSEHCRYTADDVAWLIEQSGFTVGEWIARKNGNFLLLAAERVD